MEKQSEIMIGSWPTPEKPLIGPLRKLDKAFLKDVEELLREKYGIVAKVVRLKVSIDRAGGGGSGIPPCYRIDTEAFGQTYSEWFCPDRTRAD